MIAWLTECKHVMRAVLGAPTGELQTVLMWLVATLTLVFVMRGAAAGFNVRSISWERDLLAMLLGVLVSVGAAGAASRFLVPTHAGHWVAMAIILGVALVSMVAVAPLQALLLRGKFGDVLASFVTAMGATLLLLLVAQAVLDSATAAAVEAKRETWKLRAQNVETTRMLNGN